MPKKKSTPPPRRRLSSEEAREAILAATEKRLREVGPDALRLQEIAADVGLSHPTVLHHVGSRDALVQAVVARAMIALETDLIACFTKDAVPTDIASTLHQIDDVMRGHGHARLLAWLALTYPGQTSKEESRLGDVAVALHAARGAIGRPAPFEDTAHAVVLASAAMFGIALLGPGLLRMTGLPSDEESLRRLRDWFAALLMEHAGIPVAAAAGPPPRNERPSARKVRR